MNADRWRDPSGSAPIQSYVDELRALADAGLARALPAAAAPPLVVEAMSYSLRAGGKRLRPVLALAAADAIAGTRGTDVRAARAHALPVAVALELIHTYSLIHDDLPAMDDDTLRRGRPTSHVVFGDGLAILAGDGLLTEAFAILSETPSRIATDVAPPDAGLRLAAAFTIARAAGAIGMVGGQAIDLHAAGKTPASLPHERTLDRVSLRDMHLRKTGALIEASVTAGGIIAGAGDPEAAALGRYGSHLGLAFQIVDDLLDIEGTDAGLGKTAGKDAAAGKPTYPAIYGVDESRRLATECVAEAVREAAPFRGRLGELAELVLARRS